VHWDGAIVELEEEVREFLIECAEGLVHLDQEIVQLEQSPDDKALIASVFRTFHTIKGTCGFFGFMTLGAITHVAENILDQVRSGQRTLNSTLTGLLLESVDAIKAIINSIETTATEGPHDYADLRARLEFALHDMAMVAVAPLPAKEPCVATPSPAVIAPPVAVAVPVPVVPPPQPAPVAEPATEDTDAQNRAAFADSTIRVDVGLLDKLMNLVGELVLSRNQLLQGTSRQDTSLLRTVQRLNVITSELQEGVLKTRMQPIGVVWNKLPRVIRDLASECGKKIHLDMQGAETELDKTIIEAIKDPLTHVVRNACDHGVETPEVRLAAGKPATGEVLLRAFHEGGHVHIEITDDGRGLDPEKLKSRAIAKGLIRPEQADQMGEREAIQLVFMPGFSTAEQVTSISGRGVGMDVVKTNIEKIGGVVDIANRSGVQGSTVRIKIPLTLAIIPGLIIHAKAGEDEHRFVIPQANLLELVRLEQDSGRVGIEYVHGTPVFRRRGQLLPLTYLNRVLGLEGEDFPTTPVINIVVVQAEERPFGIVVDGIFDTQEIVVKALGRRLKGLTSYLGATIMGDGRIALILDIPGLARLSGMASQTRDMRRHDQPKNTGEERQSFLVFRAGTYERVAVPLALVSRLEQIESSRIEQASGRPVLHYRGQILPLLQLAALLGHDHVMDIQSNTTAQLIVVGEGSRQVGVIVDNILDIVEENVTFRRRSEHACLLGSAIIGGSITDILDVAAILGMAAGTNRNTAGVKAQTILILGESASSTSMHRSFLEMSGMRVREAHSFEQAMTLAEVMEPNAALLVTEDMPDEATRFMSMARETGVALIAIADKPNLLSSSCEATFNADQRDELLHFLRALPAELALAGSTR
jgi:two-component system chemotaxis sensor kinase CheA